jgi:hypothetical protein
MRKAIAPIVRSPVLVERILRDRTAHFGQTRHRETLPGTIASLLFVTATGFAVFGFVMGLSGRSIVQALLSAVKLPCLFLVTGLVCLPTFYQFSILSGSRLRFLQTIALLLTSQGISAILTLGFAPIILLFWISRADPAFLVALNLATLGLSTGVGVIFFVQGVLYAQETEPPDRITLLTWVGIFFRRAPCSLVLVLWLAVYGLVGAQLSWTLRPFFGISLHQSALWTSVRSVIAQILG